MPKTVYKKIGEPCPFCGRKKIKMIEFGKETKTGIECKCGANVYFFGSGGWNVGLETPEKIIKKWNKRG